MLLLNTVFLSTASYRIWYRPSSIAVQQFHQTRPRIRRLAAMRLVDMAVEEIAGQGQTVVDKQACSLSSSKRPVSTSELELEPEFGCCRIHNLFETTLSPWFQC